MAQRLLNDRHQLTITNRSPEPIKALEKKGATAAYSTPEVAQKLPKPKIVWIMVPSGAPVDEVIQELVPQFSKGDMIIDGGNSNYKDSIRRYQELKAKGIHFLDVGTSGGIWGLEKGYCLMIGGDQEIFKKLEPIFKSLAGPEAYLYVGPSGAGHHVKMVHNGIEYGMLQAYGEGFEIMKASGYPLDFEKISKLWNHGSVVRSWLLELAERAFAKDAELASLEDYVEDSGEGRWTIAEAIEKNVPAPIITLSLLTRLYSRQKFSYSAKFIAALRNEFGGHSVKKQEPASAGRSH